MTNEELLERRNRVARPTARRIARAFNKGNARIAAAVPRSTLERALSKGAAAASALYSEELVAESYEPTARIVGDAVLRGGRLGMLEVPDVD